MKNSIDLLGILLPALIIILALLRAFSKTTKGINGLTIFLGIILLIIGLIRYTVFPLNKNNTPKEAKPIPLSVSKHSQSFNNSLQSVLDTYYALTSAFAINDSSAVNVSSDGLIAATDSFRIDDLKTDTLIYQTALQPHQNIKYLIAQILNEPVRAGQLRSFHQVSTELFSLLSIVRYDLAKIYWFECADAMEGSETGNWLSDKEGSVNPYNKNDCAEIKTTLNFLPDSTKKQ